MPTKTIELDDQLDRYPVSLPVLQKEKEDGHACLVEVFGRDVEMTCDNCSWAACCQFAWDPYNTDGDCLASK